MDCKKGYGNKEAYNQLLSLIFLKPIMLCSWRYFFNMTIMDLKLNLYNVYQYSVFIQKKEVGILLKWSNLFVQEIVDGTTNLYTIHKLPVFGYMNIVQCTYTYIIYECMLKTSHLNTGFLTLKFLFIFESLL